MDGEVPTLRELLGHALFAEGFSDSQLDSLSQAARLCDVSKDQILFTEGTLEDDLFVVVSGHVALEMLVPRQGKIRLLTVGAGELVGWSGLIGDGRMTASAVVIQDGRLIAFSSQALLDLCHADHELGYLLMARTAKAISQRLLATRLQLLDLFSETEPQIRPASL